MIKNIIIAFLLLAVIGLPVYYRTKIYKAIEKSRKEKLAEKNKEREFTYSVSVTDSSLKGYLLITPSLNDNSYGHCIIMDMSGKVVVQKDLNGGAFDFRQWHIGNKIYYTYAKDDSAAYHNAKMPKMVPAGYVVVLDSALNEIKTLHLIPHDDITRQDNKDLDVHDIIMLSENHFITLVSYEKEVSNIPAGLNPTPHKKVYASVIQESSDGKVIWQWDGSQFPEFYTNSKTGSYNDSLATDYTHVNTITLDPKDSNLVVSFRDMDQIFKVDKHTGKIIWRLGGENSDFPISESQRFFGQHAVKFTDDNKSLLFIDNGNAKMRPYTSICEIQLDEKNKKISSFKKFKIPEGYIEYRGSVSKLGDNYLVCGGTSGYLLIFDPKTDKYLFHLQSDLVQYRAYWTNSIYGLEKKSNDVAAK